MIVDIRGVPWEGMRMLRCRNCGEDKPARLVDSDVCWFNLPAVPLMQWTCPTCGCLHIAPKEVTA